MKYLWIARLAICLLTSGVHPFPNGGSSSSSEDPWDIAINWIIDKAENAKTETPKDIAYLKNNMESRDLCTQDQSSQVDEVEHKLSVESEKLHVRLMRELSRLEKKLSSYTGQSRLGPRRFQSRLATLAHCLQTNFSSNVRELCSRFRHYAGRPEESYQESTRRIIRRLDQGVQELQLFLDNFDAQVSKATGKLGGTNRSERWRVAAAQLGREVGEAAMALRATATGLPGSSGALGKGLLQGVTQFCCRSMAHIERFDTWVKQQSEGLETGWVREHPLHGRLSTLSGDFSKRLNALLTDIRQTLN